MIEYTRVNMKFSEYVYKRPNVEEIGNKLQTLIEEFGKSDAKRQIEIMYEFFEFTDDFGSMATIASIRHSIDTKDEFYIEEQKYLDENGPLLQNYFYGFSMLAFNSPHRKELKKEFGTHFFEQIEVGLKAFDEKMIPLMIEENKLSTEYDKLIASAQIEFNGKTYTLMQMSPFLQHKDREIRHKAQLKVSGFFEENEAKIDEIYDN